MKASYESKLDIWCANSKNLTLFDNKLFIKSQTPTTLAYPVSLYASIKLIYSSLVCVSFYGQYYPIPPDLFPPSSVGGASCIDWMNFLSSEFFLKLFSSLRAIWIWSSLSSLTGIRYLVFSGSSPRTSTLSLLIIRCFESMKLSSSMHAAPL